MQHEWKTSAQRGEELRYQQECAEAEAQRRQALAEQPQDEPAAPPTDAALVAWEDEQAREYEEYEREHGDE